LTASFEVRRRAKATRAFQRGQNVLVVPKDTSKVMRIVSFLPTGILCANATTGEICPANDFKALCYHCLAAWKRIQANEKRRRTLKAKRMAA